MKYVKLKLSCLFCVKIGKRKSWNKMERFGAAPELVDFWKAILTWSTEGTKARGSNYCGCSAQNLLQIQTCPLATFPPPRLSRLNSSIFSLPFHHYHTIYPEHMKSVLKLVYGKIKIFKNFLINPLNLEFNIWITYLRFNERIINSISSWWSIYLLIWSHQYIYFLIYNI